MSTIKNLKENPDNNVNLADIAKLFCGNRKTKYTTAFLSMMKNSIYSEKQLRAVRTLYFQKYNIPIEDLTQLNPIQLFFLDVVLEKSLGDNNLISYLKFCEYNERGLIKENDITKYKTFMEIADVVKIADDKIAEKEFEKQIKVIHEDDEWFILRPLTFQSSRKYGSGTKWCTTTENNSDYFVKYASKGILIYCLNRKTHYRVAAHKFLNPDSEQDKTITFWDETDKKIDSMECGLPEEILKLIKCEILTYPMSNFDFLNKKDQKNQKNPTRDENGRITYASRWNAATEHDMNNEDEDEEDGDENEELPQLPEETIKNRMRMRRTEMKMKNSPQLPEETIKNRIARAEAAWTDLNDETTKARLDRAIGKKDTISSFPSGGLLSSVLPPRPLPEEDEGEDTAQTLLESLTVLDNIIRSNSNEGQDGVANAGLTEWSKKVGSILKKFER